MESLPGYRTCVWIGSTSGGFDDGGWDVCRDESDGVLIKLNTEAKQIAVMNYLTIAGITGGE